jgi:hypothetical protein
VQFLATAAMEGVSQPDDSHTVDRSNISGTASGGMKPLLEEILSVCRAIAAIQGVSQESDSHDSGGRGPAFGGMKTGTVGTTAVVYGPDRSSSSSHRPGPWEAGRQLIPFVSGRDGEKQKVNEQNRFFKISTPTGKEITMLVMTETTIEGMKQELAKYESIKTLQMKLIWREKVLDDNILREMMNKTSGVGVLHLSGGTQIVVENRKNHKIVLTVDSMDTMLDIIKQIIVRWGGYHYHLTRSNSVLVEEKTVGYYHLQSLETLYATEIVEHTDFRWSEDERD